MEEQIYDSRHTGQEVDEAVEAVKTEIPQQLTQIGSKLGDLANLQTSAKTSAVAAINEAYNRIGVIDNSIEWIKPNWYGYVVGQEPVPHTDTKGAYQSTFFKVLKGDKVKVLGRGYNNNYAVCGTDKKVINSGLATDSEITEVTINQDGYFYFWANYSYPMSIAVIRDNEAIIWDLQGKISINTANISKIEQYIHIEDVGTVTESTTNYYNAYSAVVSIVSGKCSISSYATGGQVIHYLNATPGLYFVKRDSNITGIKLTDEDPSATVIIYYCNKTEYEWFLKQIADDSRSLESLNNLMSSEPIAETDNISSSTNIPLSSNSQKLVVVEVISTGTCAISSWGTVGSQQTHYTGVGTGKYIVKRPEGLTSHIRITDLSTTTTVKVYKIPDNLVDVISILYDDYVELNDGLDARIEATVSPMQQFIIAHADNITTSTNIQLDARREIVIAEVVGTGSCSISTWGTVGSQIVHYFNIGAGKYIVKRPEGQITHLRITDINAETTINVYNVPSNIDDSISILYDDYTNLDSGLNARIDSRIEATVSHNYQFVDYSDSYYDSLGKYIASYRLANDYLKQPYFNKKLANKDSLGNSAGKTCYYDGYIYVLKYQNHLASGNGESEYLHLTKVSISDNTDYSDIIAFDADEVLTFQDSSITIVKAHEGCLNVNANGIDICTYIEYIDSGNTKYQMIHKHFSHSLVEQNVNKCSLVYDSQTYNFAHSDIPAFMQGYQFNTVFNAGLAFDGTYYYGAWGEKMSQGTYILRTSDFITWNYVFEIPKKYAPYGEVGLYFSTNGSALYCAIRHIQTGTYIVKIMKSNWTVIENIWVKGESSMGTFFKFNDKIYAFVTNGKPNDRHYYRFINIDENNFANSHIICDTNGVFFGPNTTISTDGTYLYGCEININLRVLKFVLPTVQKSECDSIIAGLLNT